MSFIYKTMYSIQWVFLYIYIYILYMYVLLHHIYNVIEYSEVKKVI